MPRFTDEQNEVRYAAALHAVQAGIAAQMGQDEIRQAANRFTSTKQLRTGIDSAHISHLAVAELLIDKGICTRSEYIEALADAAETEKARWEKSLSRQLGAPVSLL